MRHTERLEQVDIDKLIPYENNPRTHSAEQIEKIRQSIREFGFINPVLIDKDYGIIAGHGRIESAKLEGYKKVPCVFVEHLTDEQKKAYIIADNKLAEMAGWDYDLLESELFELEQGGYDIDVIGFDDIELTGIFDKHLPTCEDDYKIEVPEKPRAKHGDVYKLGKHRVMCGDSTKAEDVKRLMNGNTADLVVTDPPYNVDYGSKAESINKYGYGFSDRHIANDNMSEHQFTDFLESAFKNMADNLKSGGAFYIWHASTTLYELETALRLNNLKTRQQLIWNKNSFVLGRQDYQWKHEPCLYGWKSGASHYFIDDRTQTTVIEDMIPNYRSMKKSELVELLDEVYSDKVSTTIINERRPLASEEHPTIKPIKLLARLVRNSSKIGDNVLDLFGGSGSTLIACEQLERKCYMMELDPKYVDVIIDRWEAYTGRKAEHEV